MIPLIKKYLSDNWDKLKIEGLPKDLLFIKFADRFIRHPDVGNISFLVKQKISEQEKPLFIMRFPRYPSNQYANQSLEKENENMSFIHGRLADNPVAKTIPSTVFWEKINGSQVLAISLMEGVSLSEGMVPGNLLQIYNEKFKIAFSWHINFQKAIGPAGEISADEIFSSTAENYLKTFPALSSLVKKYLLKIQDAATALGSKKIPAHPQHVDFHAGNIFTINKKVSGVIDWEDFVNKGIPVFDVFHFIRTYFEAIFDYLAGRRDIRSIETLSTSKEVINLIRSGILDYCKLMGIDPEFLKVLLPLYLVESASIAGSPRKQALNALERIELLLKLGPIELEEFFLYLSVFGYRDIYRKAMSENKPGLADACKKKIESIQNLAA